MEQLLHYCWKHKLWPLKGLTTTDGHSVEVLDPGLHNHNAGPDFFNAKVKIDGTLWVGNVLTNSTIVLIDRLLRFTFRLTELGLQLRCADMSCH